MTNKSYIPILAVLGAIMLVVVAAMAPPQSFFGRDFVHAQTIDDATLTDLELRSDPDLAATDIMYQTGDQPDNPNIFASTKMTYPARAPSGTNKVTVVATKANDDASVTISPSDQDSVTDGHQVLLRGGANTVIRMTVRSEDRTVTETYTVTVYQVRTQPSDNENLSALSLSGVTLSSRFASGKTSYRGRAAYNTDEITVSYRADIGAMGAISAVTTIGAAAAQPVTTDADGDTSGHWQTDALTAGVVTDISCGCDSGGSSCSS